MGEFLLRLAVALPLVCALAVGALVAVKRGRLRVPRFALASRAAGPHARAPLDLVAIQPLSPSARLAVVRFHGREHLVGVSGQSILHIASSGEVPPTPQEEPAQWTL